MAGPARNRRVLISGAGIAGLTLAILLKERGFEPVVVERERGLRTEGTMMDFFGAGWDVAGRMGLIEKLRVIKYPIDRMEFVDRDGRTIVSVPIERVRKALDNHHVHLRRSDLERILFERALAADVEVRLGTSIESIVEEADCVEVELTSGARERFALVFGADGVHSRVRELVFGEEEAFAYHLGGYVAAFHLMERRVQLDGAFRLHEETDQIAALYPVGGGWVDVTFVFRDADMGDVPADERLPLLRERLSGFRWIDRALHEGIAVSTPVYFDALMQIRMPSWHSGRVALLGDACGCLTLLAGQGAQMAMADAYVLATELHRHDKHTAAFQAYEELMAPAIMKRQIDAEKFTTQAIPSSRSRFWLRRLVTRLLFSRIGLQIGVRFFGSASVLAGYP